VFTQSEVGWLDRAGEVQVECEISVASLRREGWNNCDCECTDAEIFNTIEGR
jgi:hypothetical protein